MLRAGADEDSNLVIIRTARCGSLRELLYRSPTPFAVLRRFVSGERFVVVSAVWTNEWHLIL
jgi:hypothetical protein